ncbi:MAG: pilus assembly PilX N-terminal domain-containing protein [Candidatus Omnitrophota bacterium]
MMSKNPKNKRTEKRQKGTILILVMAFLALMALTTISLATLVQQDVKLIQCVRDTEQARFMAEAGINHAIANLKKNNFSSRSAFSGTMDTGSYSVEYGALNSSGRLIVSSTGTASGVSKTVCMEISSNMPTALYYFAGAGNDIYINSILSHSVINGDIHANGSVFLKSNRFLSSLTIAGDVSASGTVKEGTRYNTGDNDNWDNKVTINENANDTAEVYEGEEQITFPVFDYQKYKDAAIASGDYYASDQEFDNSTLSPANGIVYVDGDVTFFGTCTLNGGIIAKNIYVGGFEMVKVLWWWVSVYKYGRLDQQKTQNNRNVIISKEGNILIYGPLNVQEALVYSSGDIETMNAGADVNINGIILAGTDISMWNFVCQLDYNYIYLEPEDMQGGGGDDTFSIVGWT